MTSLERMLSVTLLCLFIVTLSFDFISAQNGGRRPKQNRLDPSQSQIDLALVVGMSSTIGSGDNWRLILAFCKQLVSKLNVDSGQTQVAMVTFGDEATTQFQLNDNKKLDAIQIAIDSTTFTQGQVDLKDALVILRSTTFTPKFGSRDGAGKFAVIITDSDDNVPQQGTQLTLKYAQKCKDAGIRLIIVGIIHDQSIVNMQRWETIVSDPTTDIVSVATFKQLRSLVNPVAKLLQLSSIVTPSPIPEFESTYQLTIFTACKMFSGTSAHITLTIFDAGFKSEPFLLTPPGGSFDRGSQVQLTISLPIILTLPTLSFETDRAGIAPDWLLWKVLLNDYAGKKFFYLDCYCWIQYKYKPLARPTVAVSVTEAFRIMSDKCT